MSTETFGKWITRLTDRVDTLHRKTTNPLRLVFSHWAAELEREADTCYGMLASIALHVEINNIDPEPYSERLEQAQQQLEDIQVRLEGFQMLHRVVQVAGQIFAIVSAIHIGSPIHLGALLHKLLGPGNNI